MIEILSASGLFPLANEHVQLEFDMKPVVSRRFMIVEGSLLLACSASSGTVGRFAPGSEAASLRHMRHIQSRLDIAWLRHRRCHRYFYEEPTLRPRKNITGDRDRDSVVMGVHVRPNGAEALEDTLMWASAVVGTNLVKRLLQDYQLEHEYGQGITDTFWDTYQL
ncbi:hypothetical protein K445DRAFT_18585 [Daldinia sp. EC12]|nr:hypothetical protein K445DRAFT_18585 [Daldinia sp. EC12]